MTEEEQRLDDEHHAGYLLGVSVGWKDVAKDLRAKAGAALNMGHDDAARLLRSPADEVDSKAVTRRAAYDGFKEELKRKEAK